MSKTTHLWAQRMFWFLHPPRTAIEVPKRRITSCGNAFIPNQWPPMERREACGKIRCFSSVGTNPTQPGSVNLGETKLIVAGKMRSPGSQNRRSKATNQGFDYSCHNGVIYFTVSKESVEALIHFEWLLCVEIDAIFGNGA